MLKLLGVAKSFTLGNRRLLQNRYKLLPHDYKVVVGRVDLGRSFAQGRGE